LTKDVKQGWWKRGGSKVGFPKHNDTPSGGKMRLNESRTQYWWNCGGVGGSWPRCFKIHSREYESTTVRETARVP
jgi:hypothetical protein